MMGLLQTIKQASAETMNAQNPVHVLFGRVTNEHPLTVNIEQRFTLTAEFLIVPERLTPYYIDASHTHQYTDTTNSGSVQRTTGSALDTPLEIRRPLAGGDHVILLRVQGGQKYLVLDRVV